MSSASGLDIDSQVAGFFFVPSSICTSFRNISPHFCEEITTWIQILSKYNLSGFSAHIRMLSVPVTASFTSSIWYALRKLCLRHIP